MKITEITVAGFGIWSDLDIEQLDGELTVFFGANEAGKTTLMQFIRTVLYGFSPERRERYLPPVHGGEAGGALQVATQTGDFTVLRRGPLPDQKGDPGTVRVITEDGTEQGVSLLETLLGNIDESIFSNVFAIGLRDLQELGTLRDTAAAEYLYKLAHGLDRVSLLDVMHELEQSRNRLLSGKQRVSQIPELLARRHALQAEIEQLAEQGRHWAQLYSQRAQLQGQATQLEIQIADVERQANTLQLTVQLRELWDQRAQLDRQLALLPELPRLPENVLPLLDRLAKAVQQYRKRYSRLHGQRRDLRESARALNINKPLWANAARIEALGEHGQWISSLQGQVDRLEADIAEVELEAQAICESGAGAADAKQLATLTSATLSRLAAPASVVRKANRVLKRARSGSDSGLEELEQLDFKLSEALEARQAEDLNSALEAAGQRVAQLRRRVQLDDRLEQMARHHTELQEQSSDLLHRQVLPMWVLIGVGSLFVGGVLLILVGLFGGTLLGVPGTMGWGLAFLGACGTGAAVATKITLERSAARKLEACNRQLELLAEHTEQAKQERETLDRQIPSGGGPLTSRLAAAEAELRELEELAPLDAQRQSIQKQREQASGRLTKAENAMSEARRRWRSALRQAALPEEWTPAQVHSLSERAESFRQAQLKLQSLRDELLQRKRELTGLTSRIEQLAADVRLPLQSPEPEAQLRQLASALAEQQQRMQQRQTLSRQDRKLRATQRRYVRRAEQLRRRRRQLLIQAGVSDEARLRLLVQQHAQQQQLRDERAKLHHQITAALAGVCSEQDIARELEPGRNPLEQRCERLHRRVQDERKTLQELHQRLGAIGQEMKSLVQDRRLEAARLELGCVERRLEEATRRWQTVATTLAILHHLRHLYETQRQPEALREASHYLMRITSGQYQRVWTPLGRETLLVENEHGESLPLELLSRGTREAVFISLRLALAAAYGRRTAVLPLVMDDVLVNFDARRAKATAELLRDFTRNGHQLLMFTCHEHIMKIFKAAKAEIRLLPSHSARNDAELDLEEEPGDEALDWDEEEVMLVEDEPVEDEAADEPEAHEPVMELDESTVDDGPVAPPDAEEPAEVFDQSEPVVDEQVIEEAVEREADPEPAPNPPRRRPRKHPKSRKARQGDKSPFTWSSPEMWWDGQDDEAAA